MVDKKKVKEVVEKFRERLKEARINPREIEKTVMEGLSSARSEIRAMAAKVGISRYDKTWVKKNVLQLLENEKSKKVLRVIERYYTGDKLQKALDRLGMKDLRAKPLQSTRKRAKPAEGAAAPAAAAEEPKAE